MDEKVENLVSAIETLKQELDIPLTIKETLHGEDRDFYEKLENLAEQAFDDQCSESSLSFD